MLSIEIGNNESSKFWFCVLTNLKNRGVKDIFTICVDGLSGMKDEVEAAFSQTEYQRCIVYMIRNILKHVSYKDRKNFANDLKEIYKAPNEEIAHKNLLDVKKNGTKKYPHSIKRCSIIKIKFPPIFKYSFEIL